MFKNLLVYRLAPEWQPDLGAVDQALQKTPFIECGATQPLSLGWVGPRGQPNSPLVEAVAGHWLMALMVEQKVVPGSVVRRQVDALAERIEQETGRAPGKKQRRELKDQALLDLLPMAFTKQAATRLWICPAERLLVVDAGSQTRADEALTALAQGLPGFAAQLVNTALSPAAAMADWLVSGDAPSGFTIDRDCELKAADGEKSAVRYARHPLDLDEIREHIRAGKQPTRLALTWNDRVSFTLTDGLQLKKLAFLDGVFERQPGASKDDNFDTDLAISTGELVPLIGDLLDALGGEAVFGDAAHPAPTSTPVAAPVESPVGAPPVVLPSNATTDRAAGRGSAGKTAGDSAVKSKPKSQDLPPWEDEAA